MEQQQQQPTMTSSKNNNKISSPISQKPFNWLVKPRQHLLPMMTSSKHNNNKASSISQKPFIWLVKPRQHWLWDTVRQYTELVILLNVLTYLFFRRYMYPHDVLEYIYTIKVISVLLESCLALPQIVLNYKRKSTEGLSLVMVLGWVLGDMMKLIYFIIGSSSETRTRSAVPEELEALDLDEGGSSSDMTIFIFGCISALIMDLIVGIQVTKWYPSLDMKNLREKCRRWWFKFEIKILRINHPTDRHHTRRGKSRALSEAEC
eukprot:CAMPEP_0204617810 /NCGR_PEP_ID=MMETSP0717-20131115/4678_1 /ASSEMBLY_ACC=CAM_ASM_000666 /TAXON_ID=230516 /ORGANISM="Chaetoceros curvisetus" /LENGTH=261 /DNA_ID=CAMNT_0051631441 /DNA_START=58 /DNA_END=843 /DNA_ORIENTATION=+